MARQVAVALLLLALRGGGASRDASHVKIFTFYGAPSGLVKLLSERA